ncbi:MAG: hypothetical protein EXR80_10205 [Methylococcales bacterium]|nr:hypothetical protein [Methylococcales bacterium]
MALPFILWGAAALLAGTGVVKGIGAVSDFDDAKSLASRRVDVMKTLKSVYKNPVIRLIPSLKN